MTERSSVRRVWDWIMSLGSYPGESDVQRGRRRIVVGYIIIGFFPRMVLWSESLAAGRTGVAVSDFLAGALPVVANHGLEDFAEGIHFLISNGDRPTI